MSLHAKPIIPEHTSTRASTPAISNTSATLSLHRRHASSVTNWCLAVTVQSRCRVVREFKFDWLKIKTELWGLQHDSHQTDLPVGPASSMVTVWEYLGCFEAQRSGPAGSHQHMGVAARWMLTIGFSFSGRNGALAKGYSGDDREALCSF